MVISRCEDCNHRHICKHKDEYEKVIGDITVKVPEPFTLILNCKHYYSTVSYLTSNNLSSTVNYANITDTVDKAAGSYYLNGNPGVVY